MKGDLAERRASPQRATGLQATHTRSDGDAVGIPTRRSARCSVAIPGSGLSADVISQVDAPNLLGVVPWVGRPVPTHASVAGKIMLADLAPADRESYSASFAFPRLTQHTIVEPAGFLAELETVAAQGYAETVDELEQGSAASEPPPATGAARWSPS